MHLNNSQFQDYRLKAGHKLTSPISPHIGTLPQIQKAGLNFNNISISTRQKSPEATLKPVSPIGGVLSQRYQSHGREHREIASNKVHSLIKRQIHQREQMLKNFSSDNQNIVFSIDNNNKFPTRRKNNAVNSNSKPKDLEEHKVKQVVLIFGCLFSLSTY